MTLPSAETCGWAGALLVLAASVVAALITQATVGEADLAIGLRARQLEQLRAMQGSGGLAASAADPCALDGLFEGARLRWHRGAGAVFLQLQPATGGPR